MFMIILRCLIDLRQRDPREAIIAQQPADEQARIHAINAGLASR